MAEWTGTILTKAGRQLLAKVLAGGTQIEYTRVALGDDVPAADTDWYGLTGLVSHQLDLPARSAEIVGDGTAKIEVILSNSTLTKGFFAAEIGVFAKDGDKDILYAYDNCGDKCDYVPAFGRINPVNYILDVFMVVSDCDNITITINNSLLFITKEEYLAHANSENPHPNMLQIGSTVTDCVNVFVNQGNQRRLDQMTMDDFRTKVLGAQASTIPALSGRVTQLEREQANISLALVAQQIYPDSNLMLTEDFVVPDKVDTFICHVLSIVAGDNGIDVESMAGIVPGAWYTVTDGINQEYIQIRSCIKNGSVFRVIANKDIEHTYLISQTLLLRSTAQIGAGIVYGSGDKKGFLWQPTLTWAGVNANIASTVKLETTQDKADLFTMDGDVEFSASGYFTLTME